MLDKVLVYSASDLFEANLLKALLESEGIETILLNQQDHMYQFGSIHIFVKPEQSLKSLQIIHKYLHHGS